MQSLSNVLERHMAARACDRNTSGWWLTVEELEAYLSLTLHRIRSAVG
jgi:hypothetical protein